MLRCLQQMPPSPLVSLVARSNRTVAAGPTRLRTAGWNRQRFSCTGQQGIPGGRNRKRRTIAPSFRFVKPGRTGAAGGPRTSCPEPTFPAQPAPTSTAAGWLRRPIADRPQTIFRGSFDICPFSTHPQGLLNEIKFLGRCILTRSMMLPVRLLQRRSTIGHACSRAGHAGGNGRWQMGRRCRRQGNLEISGGICILASR